MSIHAKHTSEQTKVITHLDGPLIVVAGAGTGKTHTIVERIAYLINEKGVAPDSILALTFTEKARDEMHNRVSEILPLSSAEPFIGTFHSFADHVLRTHGLEIGLQSDFTLLKDADLLVFLRRHLSEFPLKYYRTRGVPTQLLMSLSSYFSRLQDEDISPQQYSDEVARLAESAAKEEDVEYATKHTELAKLYAVYLELLVREGMLDYAGLTYHAAQLLKNHSSIRKYYGEKYRYIIVDEFQDTNIVQNLMVDSIARQHNNIMVVGDDDQAIYKWRGASLYNILHFRDSYEGAQIVPLTNNFRSTQQILDCAYSVIQKNNPHRLEVKEGINKKLIAQSFDRAKVFDIPELHHFARHAEEIEYVLTKAQRLLNQKKKVAILARTNALLRPYIEECASKGIPYETSTTITLLQKQVVKDIVSFLRVILNPWDDLSLYRVLSHACFGIQMKDLHEQLARARKESISLYTLITDTQWNGVKKMLEAIIEQARKSSVSQVIGSFLEQSGYLEFLKKDESGEQVEDLAAFSQHIQQFQETHAFSSVADFLEYIHLADDVGSTTPHADFFTETAFGISLMTVHAAKGLEFDCVFIVGTAQNKFPGINRSDAFEVPENLVKEKNAEGSFVEEERRLFYVACTRAKEKLFITYSDFYDGSRKFKPSLFAEEARTSGTARLIDHAQDSTTLDQLALNFETQKSPTSPVVKSGKKITLSYSQLGTFETCPKKYHYRYELHLPEPPNAHMSFGISLHNTLKDFGLALIDRQQKSAQSAVAEEFYTDADLAVLRRCFEANWSPFGYSSKADVESNKEQAWECLEKFFDAEKKLNRIPWSVERSFSCDLGALTMSGRIDRIDKLPDGTYEIIDYKSGKSSSYNIKKDLQLSIYALAARDSLNITVSKYTLYFLETGEQLSAGRSESDIELCREELLNATASIAQSNFEATPGFHCGFCPYRMICPDAV